MNFRLNTHITLTQALRAAISQFGVVVGTVAFLSALVRTLVH